MKMKIVMQQIRRLPKLVRKLVFRRIEFVTNDSCQNFEQIYLNTVHTHTHINTYICIYIRRHV